MSQTKKQLSKNKIGSFDRASISPGQLRSNYGSVRNRGGRASQLSRQQSARHSLEDLVEPPSRSGKSRRGSIFQQVRRKKQQLMNQQPSCQIEEHEQVEEEYLQPPEERSGRTRNTPLPTRSPPPRDRGGQSLPITPSRRSPRGLDNNRVQRSLEAEYSASNTVHMQRHRQVQHQSDQLYNTQVSSSSRQQPLGLQHQGSRSSSSQRQSQTPSNGAPLGNRNISNQNTSHSEPQQNDTPEDQHLQRKHPSRSTSNSPQSNEECGTAEITAVSLRKKRGRSCMKELSKFRGQILELDLYEGRLCRYKNEVAINSVCMWTRQSQNCPLNYDAFDDIPPINSACDQKSL
ncbi:uncharacterized protein LOC113331766 isoform X2 [Papaver somniferum]|uniref:uncharacterized protein LOC113331766 isoform X2 n=1 Tax=Papaver somniferum TaxID=3469 RepID=UPI000E6FBD54|nr:uncharacterized protein LOC113331766 isoform X2 [Papaver somniferum]